MRSLRKVYPTLEKYYSFGLKPSDPGYTKHSKTVKVHDIMYSKLNDSDKIRLWQRLLTDIRNSSSSRCIVSSNNQPTDVSFNGYVILKKEHGRVGNFTRTLCFHISVLGPFFTIYGLDTASIELCDEKNRTGFFHPIVWNSPVGIYTEAFNMVVKAIRTYYANYEALSFSYLEYTIENLYIDMAPRTNESARLFEALFTSFHNNYQLRGDLRYEI